MLSQIVEIISGLLVRTGIYNILLESQGNFIMIGIGLIFVYLGIVKEYEPYELLPIGIGAIIVNLPLHQVGMFSEQMQNSGLLGVIFYYSLYFYNILPPLIFISLGALTDFGPLIANPKMLLLGGAAQVGIFVTFIGALWLGFDIKEAASIGIIGGADGPTTIYTTAMLAPHLLGITAVTAYSYMSLVPVIQPPIMRLLTTKKERMIRMEQLRPISKRTKIMFPLFIIIVSVLLIPMCAPLVSMFMIGNIFRESGVVERLTKGAQNELLNLVTMFLMLAIGTTLKAETILQLETFKILALGLVAFSAGSASGILFAKIMNIFSHHKINPLIGSAGVSAVPMAARVSADLAYHEDPTNHILMHAMGPNVAGVIGSAIVAGYFLTVINY